MSSGWAILWCNFDRMIRIAPMGLLDAMPSPGGNSLVVFGSLLMTNSIRPPGLIQRYREALQARHYARRTVAATEQWLRRVLRFHHPRHPRCLPVLCLELPW